MSSRPSLPAVVGLAFPFAAGALAVSMWVLGEHRPTGANQDVFSALLFVPVVVCAVRSHRVGLVQMAARLAVTSASALLAVYSGAFVAWFGLVLHDAGVLDGLTGVLALAVGFGALTARRNASDRATT